MFRGGMVRVGAETIPFERLTRLAFTERVSLSATGYYATPKITWDRDTASGRPFLYFAGGAACSEVTVDIETGEMRVDRVDILHDAGRSLNPAIDMGQIEGGFVQGMGWLTTEELVFADDGRLLTHAPSTYKIPACSDVPADFRVELFEPGRNREPTIHRSKAVGEPPLMLAISVFSAITHALASLAPGRVPPLDAPATPEAILRAADAIAGGWLLIRTKRRRGIGVRWSHPAVKPPRSTPPQASLARRLLGGARHVSDHPRERTLVFGQGPRIPAPRLREDRLRGNDAIDMGMVRQRRHSHEGGNPWALPRELPREVVSRSRMQERGVCLPSADNKTVNRPRWAQAHGCSSPAGRVDRRRHLTLDDTSSAAPRQIALRQLDLPSS